MELIKFMRGIISYLFKGLLVFIFAILHCLLLPSSLSSEPFSSGIFFIIRIGASKYQFEEKLL